jgi:uncharacterized cupin superfamily protein
MRLTKVENAQAVLAQALEDWGDAPSPLSDPAPKVRGQYVSKEGPRAGIWECSPGRFRRVNPAAEVAHFVIGRCSFTPDNGETVEIKAGDTFYLPENSFGEWVIHETVRKSFVIL